MRTAGVDLNTRQMRAGICRSGNEAHKRRKHGVFTEVDASGIPWPLAVADVPEGAHRRAETGRNGGSVRFWLAREHDWLVMSTACFAEFIPWRALFRVKIVDPIRTIN